MNIKVFILFFFFTVSSTALLPQNIKKEIDKVEKIIPSFEAYAQKAMDKSKTPGMAIAIVEGDSVKYIKCFGVRKVGYKEGKIDENTVFQIASCSKPFTSTLLAKLVGEKKIKFTDKVCELDPTFFLYDEYATREMILTDLLAHRTGMPSYAGNVLSSVLGYNKDEIYYRLRFLKPISSFREKWTYQNYLYSKAAYIAADLEQSNYFDLMEENIFTPLKMERTSAKFLDFLKRKKNKAVGHVLKGEKMQPQPYFNPDNLAPAGGVSSTIKDLTNFLIMQINEGVFRGKEIVNKDALLETHRPHMVMPSITGTEEKSYGLGWIITHDFGEKIVAHEGAFEKGINTIISFIPEKRVGIIVLTNAAKNGLVGAVAMKFNELYLTGKSKTDWYAIYSKQISNLLKDIVKPPLKMHIEKDSMPSLPFQNYLGVYSNDYYGNIKVVQDNGSLYVYMGKNKIAQKLSHITGNVFGTDDDFEIIFSSDANNNIIDMYIDQLNFDGRNGRFKKKDNS